MSDELIYRTDSEQKIAEELYQKYREALIDRQLSNSENYDKAILSLSSAGLAISFAFLEMVTPISEAIYLGLVIASWILFGATISCSIVAYIFGNKIIDKQLKLAEEYYIYKKRVNETQSSRFIKLNENMNIFTGILFVLSITFLIAFFIINISANKEGIVMTDKNQNLTVEVTKSASIPSMQMVTDSASIPMMQAAPGTPYSASIPVMQSAPETSKPAPTSSTSESK